MWKAYKVGVVFCSPAAEETEAERFSHLLEVIALGGKGVWPLTAPVCASQRGCAWLLCGEGDRMLGISSHPYIDQIHKLL